MAGADSMAGTETLTHFGALVPLHPRPRPSFVLTPLADIMFQLLIFFMLSTSLAPYAILPLGQPAAQGASPAASPVSPAIWHLGEGQIRYGLRWVPLADAGPMLDILRAEGTDEILLFITENATTQDLAIILEKVQTEGGLRLRLVAR
jgi:biopolymer transport protein ExbD